MDNQNSDIISNKERANLSQSKWTLIALVIALICFYFLNFYDSALTQESTAQFGDYFGGVLNPILGFATVALLVWSIQIQLRELKLTRTEMEENTKANKEQAKELNEQNILLREQRDIETSRLAKKELNELLNEQQKRVEDVLHIPIGFKSTNQEYPTFHEVMYIGDVMEVHYNNALKRRPEALTYSKKQLVFSVKQYALTLVKMIEQPSINVELLKDKIEWIILLVGLLSKKRFLEKESVNTISALISLAINEGTMSPSLKKEISDLLSL
jgi:hypothetical protein